MPIYIGHVEFKMDKVSEQEGQLIIERGRNILITFSKRHWNKLKLSWTFSNESKALLKSDEILVSFDKLLLFSTESQFGCGKEYWCQASLEKDLVVTL